MIVATISASSPNCCVNAPKLDKVIGTLDYVTKIAGASEETLREDGSLEVELQVLTGATNEHYRLLLLRLPPDQSQPVTGTFRRVLRTRL